MADPAPASQQDAPQGLVDQRLRLFAFAAARERLRHLAILRTFDAARQRYQLQLSPDAVAIELHACGVQDVPDDLEPSLDQLADWGVLARTQDNTRVRSLAEYRKRRSVYEMTEPGWLAWAAVEGVIAAGANEAELKRLVLPSVLEDLRALAEANAQANGERVAMLLGRVDATLTDLANRGRRFQLAMADLARTHEATPEVFLAHKDRLLQHMADFIATLQQHRPLIARAVAEVEATDVQALVERASRADAGAFLDDAARRAKWQRHWDGVVVWFVGTSDVPCEAERLDVRTTRAIRDLAALLRRVSEARRGTVSRASELELLARWFTALPDDGTAHALFALSFGLRPSRHLMGTDVETSETTVSWWEAPALPVDATLRKQGREGQAGPPARIRDVTSAKQRAGEARHREGAATALAEAGLVDAWRLDRRLESDEFNLLLRLLDRALQTRRPASGSVAGKAGNKRTRLIVSADPNDTVVATTSGTLLLKGMRLEIEAPTP